MTPLDHALAYTKLGWYVAPIAPGTKYPRIDNWQKHATTDTSTITRWLRTNPDHGVSIVTGLSGLVVIDIDPRHDGDEGWADLEQLHGVVDTVEALTGGGGRHLYFRMPDGHVITNAAAANLPAGIDVRGEGGQVVAPPTIHPDTSRAYAWELAHDPLDGYPVAELPAWLLELLTQPIPDQTPRTEHVPYAGTDSIIDLYAAHHTWPELLGADGWTFHSRRAHAGDEYELWTRPGKTVKDGPSATLYYKGSDVLKVWTDQAAPLLQEQTYTRFGYYTAMRHAGDHTAAARAYRRETNASSISADGVVGVGGVGKNGSVPPAADRPRPLVYVNGRDLSEVVAQITTNLDAANDPPELFVRNGKPVRVRSDENDRPMIESVMTSHLALHAAEQMQFVRSTKPTKDDPHPPPSACSPPTDIITGVLSRSRWPFPGLIGITETPVLRPDGTFHTTHGFDAATGLYHWAPGRDPINVPDQPTADELGGAVRLIDDMLCDFPWSTTADRANAWALMLTPIVRPVIGLAPLALLDAPQPGSGKTLLATATTIVATGRPAAMQPFSTNDEELEKRITTMLLAGATTIAFDNVEGTIRSPILAGALTVNTWQGRMLGRNEAVEVPNRVTWLATGNNIDVGGDMARRCYRIRLEPAGAALGRSYKHAPLEPWVTKRRSDLVAALCTIVRSWWNAGKPKAPKPPKMDSFDLWASVIAGVLAHGGVDGFLGNQADFRRNNDSEAVGWEAFLSTWLDCYGSDRSFTVKGLLSAMSASDSLIRSALPDDLAAHMDADGKPDKGFSVRLGKALSKRAGRLYGDSGVHIVQLSGLNRNKVVEFLVADGRRTRLTLDLDSAGDYETPATATPVTSNDAGSAGDAGDYPGYSVQEKVDLQNHQGHGPDQSPRTPASPALAYNPDIDEPF